MSAAVQPHIEIREVSKCYRIFPTPKQRLGQAMRDLFVPSGLKGRLRPLYREHWALRDVSFELLPGEAVGVLGRNGAGKSTLLQIIAGTLEPSSGSVVTRGRITALLELGSGFNPEFTGLENVRLNGQILGLTGQQVDERLDDILAFADIGHFVEQPVKIYSTGMLMRLAFAVQTVLDPDILIVDEALSVGDAKFQEKCFRKLQELRARGTTVLLVSHDVNAVTSFCDRALVMDRGHLAAVGPSREMAKHYLNTLYAEPAPEAADQPVVAASRFGTGAVEILEVGLLDEQGRRITAIASGAPIRLYQKVLVREAQDGLSSGFIIRNQRGLDIFGVTNASAGVPTGPLGPGDVLTLEIDARAWMAAGDYFLQAANAGLDGTQYDCDLDAVHFTVVGTPALFTTSIVNLEPRVRVAVSRQVVESQHQP